MAKPFGMPFCTVCHNILMLCPCVDIPHGQCLDYRPFETSRDRKLKNLRKYALCVESKSVSRAHGIQFVRDQEKIDIISIIERNTGRIHNLLLDYWAHRAQKITLLMNISQEQVEIYGKISYTKFINMEWKLMGKLEVIILNNAFRNADPKVYPETDKDLIAIFDVISFMVLIDSSNVFPGMQKFQAPSSRIKDCDQVCFNCSKVAPVMKKCSVCKFATYCGTECSKKNWKQHKAKCWDAKKIMVGEYPN